MSEGAQDADPADPADEVDPAERDAADPSGVDEAARAVAVVDPSPRRRSEVEALAEAVGRPVWTLDPAELGPHSFDEFLEASAVVVTWDLGGRPGLDLLEALAHDERTCDLPVALAAEEPSREQVLLALRWGARTFLHLPYDADEIRRRLVDGGS